MGQKSNRKHKNKRRLKFSAKKATNSQIPKKQKIRKFRVVGLEAG
jgi:hypothetical protein